jgi:hypothetical protein
MALWTLNPPQQEDIYTVVYFLKDALSSALEDAWFFEKTALPRADVKGAGHAEIAARLGRFRDGCKTFQEREALMLMKLSRARIWAGELRKIAPEVQHDVDQFLDGTEACEEMKGEFVRDAQRMFNGGGLLTRFLARRKAHIEERQSHCAHDGGYRVGGRTELFELRAACEVFLAQINDGFFPASQPAANGALTQPLAAYLEAPKESAPPVVPEVH